ncbi:MAG TPA: low specificity L-threonine aldolase [Candidatus Hydrogenedentes bacterium]|nr:low specificity L-threonine aldolase [Candidatus Hydrogenedentota bacterium]
MDTVVDLRSDTLTKPTAGMRDAMAAAEVGDDVFGEDPTVNALQDRCAEMFGKEAALFVPSGTMANLLGLMAQSNRGETLLIHETGHAYRFEAGNVAGLAGLMTRTLPGDVGKLTPETVKPYLQVNDNPHFSRPSILSLENTTNMGGGNLYTPEEFEVLYGMAQDAGVKLHCDGARIMNACVASGVSPADYGRYTDTITCCFSKGLGAPVGSILTGTQETITSAHRYRKMLGGGMRQAGVLAAAAMYALDNNVERLAEDHRRAAAFRDALEGKKGISFPMPTRTNILFFDVEDTDEFIRKARENGVLVLSTSPGRIRAVFHLGLDEKAVENASGQF